MEHNAFDYTADFEPYTPAQETAVSKVWITWAVSLGILATSSAIVFLFG